VVTTVIKMLPGICSKVKQYVNLTTLYRINSIHIPHRGISYKLPDSSLEVVELPLKLLVAL
jgi:hypothetical protein